MGVARESFIQHKDETSLYFKSMNQLQITKNSQACPYQLQVKSLLKPLLSSLEPFRELSVLS